jgi:hypothetical protein
LKNIFLEKKSFEGINLESERERGGGVAEDLVRLGK